jgi:hypothetical protein
MDRSVETDEAFLELVRRQLQQPELSLKDALLTPLATTLYDVMARTRQSFSSPPSISSDKLSPFSSHVESRVAIEAAIQDTFDLQALNPSDADRAALISAADVVMLGGARRLRLNDRARAELLDAVQNSQLYAQSLRDAVALDEMQLDAVGTRPPTAWLRGFLANRFANLDLMPPKELSAALAARQRLRLVTHLKEGIPSIAELERRVELADLLEPLRMLIGAEGGWDKDTPRTDRFVGRERELTELRKFVDELSPQTISEAISRWRSAAASALGMSDRASLRIIQADGGLGKSALLAKFVLDHAQTHSFPFAYLDFDRAVLDPTQPQQLLCEMARQVGLQFPAAQPEFAALIGEVSRLRTQSDSSESAATTAIRDPFANFVEILRKHATHGERAFLLILDTLEVVQWNTVAISNLMSLLYEFKAKGLVELRTVVSGRADVPELRSAAGLQDPSSNIRLKPLAIREATQMAERLGRAAISDAWQRSWSEAIAGDLPPAGLFESVKRALSPSEDVRREPLTVRIAVDLVSQADPKERQNIVEDIQTLSDDGQHSLASRLYERRIVNHVRDARARKLAWPGLVLRRVTLSIARDLLAPHCGLAPEEVEDAFRHLEQEVWMVTREGEALKHRPDLRARTLPLMRANNKEKFDAVARAAVEYFEKTRDRSLEDRTEWIYHRLQAGGAIGEVIKDITPEVLQKLAGAAEDFASDSEAGSFIASRTAAARLSPTRIKTMSANDALYHLSSTSRAVFELNDTSIDTIALELAARLGEELEGSERDLSAWAQALWIKTGHWDRMRTMAGVSRQQLINPVWRTQLYWAARMAPSLSASERTAILDQYLPAVTGERESNDRPGARATIHCMALARMCASQRFEQLDEQALKLLRLRQPNSSPSWQAALRTAIVFGKVCQGPALDHWLRGRRRGATSRVQIRTFAASELRALARISPDGEWGSQRSDGPQRVSDEQISASASSLLEQCLASSDNGEPLAEVGRKLAQVFSCRDEDWIVPLAYAAERVGYRRESVDSRLAAYMGHHSVRSQAGPPPWSDMVGAMRIADEAGDIERFAQWVMTQSAANTFEVGRLKLLLDTHLRWREAMSNLLDKQPASPATQMAARLFRSPPPPGPILDENDPQRGRWGGHSSRDGRTGHAVLESVEGDLFFFSVIVESTDGSPLQPPVIFHLHDSYPRSVIRISRIAGGKRAELSDWNATGVFAVGVQVMDRNGSWTSLEVDLAKLPGLPKRFLKR